MVPDIVGPRLSGRGFAGPGREVPETFDQAEARGLELAAAGESAAAARGRGSSRGKARTTTRTCSI